MPHKSVTNVPLSSVIQLLFLFWQCKKRGKEDYVEILGGDGLDPDLMSVAEDFCGTDSLPSNTPLLLHASLMATVIDDYRTRGCMGL